MARLPRLSIADGLHLVIQRVQTGVPLFERAQDRGDYLDCLADAALGRGVAVHAYGLAPTEIRLLLTPPDADALGHLVQQIGRRFVAGYNRRHGRSGSLWEGRFRCTVVDAAEHFGTCLRFVESLEPPGGPTQQASEPPWSSAGHHAGQRVDPLITEHAAYWGLGNTPFEREAAYRRMVERPLAIDELARIAQAAWHGWALGSDAFTAGLAKKLGRRLHPLAPGRPSTTPRDKSAK